MQKIIILIVLLTLTFQGCKEKSEPEGCGCSGNPMYSIVNEPGWMVFDVVEEDWYLARDTLAMPDPTRDRYLYPCDNWPDNLLVDSLPIIWSGDVMGICPNSKSRTRRTWFSEINKQ